MPCVISTRNLPLPTTHIKRHEQTESATFGKKKKVGNFLMKCLQIIGNSSISNITEGRHSNEHRLSKRES